MQDEPQRQLPEPQRRDNPHLKELDSQSFQLWRRHPATEAFLRYLKDQADNYRLGHLLAWEAGRPDPEVEAERRGRILMIEDLLTLDVDAMKRLYGYSDSSEAPKA